MSEDLRWELDILETVHAFYVEVLQDALGGEAVPIPAELASQAAAASLEQTVTVMRRWLTVLDMAIAVSTVRDKLNMKLSQDTAEALLRYYARKRTHTDVDRDKADFAVTFLYRNPRVPGQWESRGYSLDGIVPIGPFEIALIEIFSDAEQLPMPEEHAQLLNEFEHLKQDVDDFRDFGSLMDSGIIQRVREIKATLGPSFFHPHSLAVVAEYNAYFGARFDELFRKAAAEIRSFAERIQQAGGSIGARLDEDVTVKHLTEVREDSILSTEYRTAQEQFRYVSRLKKVVDKRRATQGAPAPAYGYGSPGRAPEPVATRSPIAQAPPVAPVAPPPISRVAPPQMQAREPAKAGSEVIAMSDHPNQLKANADLEESKLRSVEESIRAFVRAADPKFRQVVPMRNGNLTLMPHEADAYCADHLDEKSFRADNARSLVRAVAIIARIGTELTDFRSKQSAQYLWKPHADSLTFLVISAGKLQESAAPVVALAKQRGLIEKMNFLNDTLKRLRDKCTLVAETLETIPHRE